MVTVLLFDHKTYKSPGYSWWRNFAETIQGKGAIRLDTINEQLMDYNAHFHCTGKGGVESWGDRYIDFYDERAYNWFVLRWS